MDFDLSEDQQAIAELARRILTDGLAPDLLRAIEADPDWFARDVWLQLARADLLGLCLPERDGGGGYGILEAALLLEVVGRTAAPLPFLATIVLGAMTVADHGSAAQRSAILPGVIDGSTMLTAALLERGDPAPPRTPATTATADGEGWRLDGEKVLVPALHLADRVVVPARTDDGATTVFLLDPAVAGATFTAGVLTNLEPVGDLHLDGVGVGPDAVLGAVGAGGAIVASAADRAVAGLCAIQAGVCEAALRLTATYTSERHQFGAPIATFQAVAQRAADAFVDTEAVRLTARQAAWRLAEGLDAADALDIAKFWAAEGAQRVVHAAQHLHGGIGVDTEYPLHRYFRWAKANELALGGGTHHLLRLGARLAAAPA